MDASMLHLEHQETSLTKTKEKKHTQINGVECAPTEHPQSLQRNSYSTSEYVVSDERTALVPEEQKKKKISTRGKLIFAILFVGYFASGIEISIPAPFFPREAAKKNVSSATIGFVFGCYQLTNFISSPVFGHILPDVGPRLVCFTGMMVSGICTILFGFLYLAEEKPVFLSLAFILRIAESLGVSAFSTTAVAILCLEFEDKIASAFSIIGTAIGSGMMAGPVIGGVLFELGGFGLPFWVLGAFISMVGVVSLLILTNVTGLDKAPRGQDRNNMLKLLTSPLVWASMLLLFDSAVAFIFLEPILALHLAEFGISSFTTSLFFIILPVIHAVVCPLWGLISDKWDINGQLMTLGGLTCCVAFLVVGPTPIIPGLPKILWPTILGLVLYGIFFGLCVIPTMKGMVKGATEVGLPENMRTFGLVSGLFHLVFYFGAFVGPSMAGALMESVGFRWATTVVAGLFLFTFFVHILFFGYRRIQRQKRERYKQEQNLNGDNHL